MSSRVKAGGAVRCSLTTGVTLIGSSGPIQSYLSAGKTALPAFLLASRAVDSANCVETPSMR